MTDKQKWIIEALRSCWNIERTPKDCPFTVGEASCTVGCQIDRMREAADLIEQMDAEYAIRYVAWCRAIDHLREVTKKVERERDAAVRDILRSCDTCKHFVVRNNNGHILDYNCDLDGCTAFSKWEWRRPCTENERNTNAK